MTKQEKAILLEDIIGYEISLSQTDKENPLYERLRNTTDILKNRLLSN